MKTNSSMSSDKPDYTDYWNKQAQGTPFEGLGDAVKDVPPPNSSMSVDEIREQLAAIEHERWADWQKWVHSVSEKMFNTATGKQEGLMIPQELVERWERQINTPYSGLSEREKASDIEQVDRYWNLIEQYVTKKQIEELERTMPYTDGMRHYNTVKSRIAELEKQLETEGGE